MWIVFVQPSPLWGDPSRRFASQTPQDERLNGYAIKNPLERCEEQTWL